MPNFRRRFTRRPTQSISGSLRLDGSGTGGPQANTESRKFNLKGKSIFLPNSLVNELYPSPSFFAGLKIARATDKSVDPASLASGTALAWSLKLVLPEMPDPFFLMLANEEIQNEWCKKFLATALPSEVRIIAIKIAFVKKRI